MSPPVTLMAFSDLDIRVAKIIKVEPFPAARKPAYQLHLDLGPLGLLHSSAQLPPAYPTPSTLLHRLCICVSNFGERKIAGFRSQVLVLDVDDQEGRAWLVGCGEEEELVGRRVGLESDVDHDDDGVRERIEVEQFMAMGIKEHNGFVVLPESHVRLGIRNSTGEFTPITAPEQAIPGTILH